MSMRTLALKAFAVISCGAIGLLATHEAHAGLVEFVYNDTISNTSVPGLSSGDVVTLTVFADNGNTSLVNQSWTYGQTAGFIVSSGAYVGNFSAVFGFTIFPNNIAISTDASGDVSIFAIYGTDPVSVNSDNYGSWNGDTVSGGWGLTDDSSHFLDFAHSPPSSAQDVTAKFASADPIPAPEPASITMLGVGIAALAAARRRRAPSSMLLDSGA